MTLREFSAAGQQLLFLFRCIISQFTIAFFCRSLCGTHARLESSAWRVGRMLVESCNRLNIQANVLDAENSPAKQISFHDGHVTGSFKEREAVRQLAKSCDVMTAEIEHVDTYALEEVASDVQVEPSWQAIRTIQNKFNQKEHLRKYGIPMADHRELVKNTPEELAEIGEQLGYPMMLKSKDDGIRWAGLVLRPIWIWIIC